MSKQHKQVNEFMAIMGQEMPDSPTMPKATIQNLRYRLIAEENDELLDSAAKNDIVEVADALCDTLYVVLGAFTAYGFKPKLVEELFDEVQRSNMSKTCATEEEAAITLDALYTAVKQSGEGLNAQFDMRPVGDRWIVFRTSDKKVLKGINFSQPDLRSILERYGVKC